MTNNMGKFIFDPLTGVPTILATNRAKRPDQTGAVASIKPTTEDEAARKAAAEEQRKYIFCKGNEHLTPPAVYQDADDWNVRVFPNKFPLLEDHEIFVHSPDPEKDIAEFDCEQNVRLIRAYLNRIQYYTSQEKEVIIFNNRGGKAGASISHPHSQLVAAKGFPGDVARKKTNALKYFNEKESCYWCDEIQKLIRTKERLVYESAHFVIYVPMACRWSYQMYLVPKEHRPNFEYISEVEIQDLAKVLKASLKTYDILFDRPDRNFWIHSTMYEPFHWHIGFLPHIKVFGALELGSGIWVSDKATPEYAAKELGEVFREICEKE